MTAERFSELLTQLGSVFSLALHTDKFHSCSIQIPPLTIQLQLDSTQEKLFLFSKLIELPPGKFRENVLEEALKANNLSDPRAGIFCYVAASNHLALYQRFPLNILNGERLAGIFGAFYELGDAWQKAIHNGQPAPAPTSGPRVTFGIRP